MKEDQNWVLENWMTWGLEGPTAEHERDSKGHKDSERQRASEYIAEHDRDSEEQRSSKIYAEYAELDRDSAGQRDSETPPLYKVHKLSSENTHEV